MEKLLVILGPTSTGKTSLGIHLAKKYSGEIVSADSRQVYKGMDIGTGKDIPAGSSPKFAKEKKYGYYVLNGVKLWCYDIADYKKNFSVSQYQKVAREVIKEISKRKKLPIVVGGTGFYIKALVDGIESLDIPQDKSLRKSLEKSPASELFDFLGSLDPVHAASLNASDKNNPRRLIRAIEIAQWRNAGGKAHAVKGLKENFDIILVGLISSKELIEEKIKQRVWERYEEGFENEMENLINNGFLKSPQALDTLGYKQWLENKGSMEDFLGSWEKAEVGYVKKQITWFKKDTRIKWFDIGKKDSWKNIEKAVEKWYIGEDEKSSSEG